MPASIANGLDLSPAAADTLAKFPRLTELGVKAGTADDARLARLVKAAPGLTELGLGGLGTSGAVTSAGLDATATLKLRTLWLHAAKVDRDMLRAFARQPGLELLWLENTNTDDALLPELAGCRNLRRLGLTGTKVTAAGVKKLAAALPECQIVWDGGTIEPTKKP